MWLALCEAVLNVRVYLSICNEAGSVPIQTIYFLVSNHQIKSEML